MDAAADVWPAVHRQVEAATGAGADLLVLPEICYPSYLLESRDRYWRGDIERSASVIERYSALARQHGVWIVAGYVEERGDLLFNSAAVIDATGALRSTVRKQFLWDCDSEWFEAGRESFVVDTPWGRMGVLICADLRMPEITATLVARGAEFVVQPTAWVNAALGTGGFRNIQPEFLLHARSLEFGVPFASCSKSGRERSRMGYVGQSMIVDAQGKTLTQAPIEGDATIVAEIAPAPGRVAAIGEAGIAALRADPVPTPATLPDRIVSLDATRSIDEALTKADADGARTGRLAASELSSYVPARIQALQGVQMLFARGNCPDAALARARAAENRVFVCVGDDAKLSLVVDPSGVVLHDDGNPIAILEIRPGDADAKQFTPATPIWAQRYPDRYCFAADEG